MKFSIIVPIYNEEFTLPKMINALMEAGKNFDYELILVDDGSTDASKELLIDLQKKNQNIKVHFSPINVGKTASVRAGMSLATGDYIAIQDADLEYDPKDLFEIFKKICQTNAPVVYGSRVLGTNNTAYPFYYVGSRFITSFFNLLFGYQLTDLTTCYKVFKRSLVTAEEIKADGFGFCPEITCKLAKKDAKIVEVPISYAPRSFAEGKKIRVRDGIYFIWIISKNYMQKLFQYFLPKNH